MIANKLLNLFLLGQVLALISIKLEFTVIVLQQITNNWENKEDARFYNF